MDETGDREQEEHDGGDVADPGGLTGTLTEHAEPVGGEQQTTERLGPQQGVDPEALQRVGLGLQFVDLVLRRAGFLGGGDRVAGFGHDRTDAWRTCSSRRRRCWTRGRAAG